MRLTLAIVAMVTTLPIFAETLSDAIQHRLVYNPELIVNSAPSLDLKSTGGRASIEKDNFFNQLKFQTPSKNINKPGVAEDLALDVVNRYLLVIQQEKLLELAQINLRLHRSILLMVKEQKKGTRAKKIELNLIATSLARAEADRIRAEANLHAARKKYAKTVGKWPNQLIYPRIPANSDLPLSVGQAIEQGLNNYLPDENKAIYPHFSAGYGSHFDKHEVKNRSIIELSKSVRMSWANWTVAGLKLNALRKRLAMTNHIRDENQERFKAGKSAVGALLNAQKVFYKTQVDFTRAENTEIMARYQIQSTIGELLPYINRSWPEDTTTSVNSDESANLSELDRLSYPYPNYKPLFHAQLENNMENLPTAVVGQDYFPKALSLPWYVSAGKFKNKANAVALVNRLKGLGFMAFLQIYPKEASVLVGPYEYPGHAALGMERLKEIAHVEGVLVKSRHESLHG
ncbi:MAG: SPOR domain-containing protein [Legionella sp.]|nr:SPOR domain-containing protein [Legionella sp.]